MNTANKRLLIRSSWNRRTLLGATLTSLCLWSLLAGGASQSEGTEFRVLVHADSPQSVVAREFVAKAFLKQVTRWEDGETIRPVDLPATSPLRERFSKTVLKRSVQSVKHYWQQRIFSGRGLPPPELDSEAAVVRYVAKHRGGIGYVGTNVDLFGVKVLVLR